MSAGSDGLYSGAAAGALAGAPAGPYGIAAGIIIGGTIGLLKGEAEEDAAKEEQARLERKRNNAVYREIGAQRQASEAALIATDNSTSNNTRKISNSVSRENGEVGPNSDGITDEGLVGRSLQQENNNSGNTGTF